MTQAVRLLQNSIDWGRRKVQCDGFFVCPFTGGIGNEQIQRQKHRKLEMGNAKQPS